jgi:hypothetical protein
VSEDKKDTNEEEMNKKQSYNAPKKRKKNNLKTKNK